MGKALTLAVIRYDDKFVLELSYDNFVNKLVKTVLEEVPDLRRKLFMSSARYDEEIAAAIQKAAIRVRTDLFAVGLRPRTWVD